MTGINIFQTIVRCDLCLVYRLSMGRRERSAFYPHPQRRRRARMVPTPSLSVRSSRVPNPFFLQRENKYYPGDILMEFHRRSTNNCDLFDGTMNDSPTLCYSPLSGYTLCTALRSTLRGGQADYFAVSNFESLRQIICSEDGISCSIYLSTVCFIQVTVDNTVLIHKMSFGT